MLIHITGASMIMSGVFILAAGVCFVLAIGRLGLDYRIGEGIYLCFALAPGKNYNNNLSEFTKQLFSLLLPS